MTYLTLRSPAKLNLYLKVLSRRRDGYHNIKTIFERIGLFDTLTFRLRRDGKIKINCRSKHVPLNDKNIVFRAASLLQKTSGVKSGADIRIVKRIPVGAGLGGGSGNAATALLCLNRLWGLQLRKEKLADLGKSIGSDVPFFVYEIPFAQGQGRGDRIKPLASVKDVRVWHVLTVPKLHVSTPVVYKKWDSLRKAGLTMPAYNVKIWTSALKSRNLSLLSRLLLNDLEKVTLRLYPQVGKIKEKLESLGLKAILMSGSGPAVFTIVSSGKEALALRGRLKIMDRSLQVYAVKTY